MAAIEKICPEAKNLLVIPENHTRNTFYLSNVAQLKRIFHMAGLNVRIGSIDPDIKEPTNDRPARRRHGAAGAGGAQQAPAGAEEFRPLHHPAEQRPVGRHRRASWKTCTSSTCCRRCTPAGRCGARATTSTATRKSPSASASCWASIPWLINPMFNQCGEVDFTEGTGMDCLTTNVDALLTKIRKKYKEYGINEKPFVVVKADNGTYGMGIMTVRDVKDLDELNRKTRTRCPSSRTARQSAT